MLLWLYVYVCTLKGGVPHIYRAGRRMYKYGKLKCERNLRIRVSRHLTSKLLLLCKQDEFIIYHTIHFCIQQNKVIPTAAAELYFSLPHYYTICFHCVKEATKD